MKGWVVSSALIGCIIGASYSGRLGDKFGRKKILMAVSILFGISAIGSGLANSIPTFITYRIIGGIAVTALTTNQTEQKATEKISCSSCGNSCTAEKNCGLSTCGAVSGGSCGCGK